jgi:hypothetical protein
MSDIQISPATFLRTVTGLVAGAVIGAAAVDVAITLLSFALVGYGPDDDFLRILGLAVTYGAMRGAIFVVPVLIILGWPLHLLLMRLNARGLIAYALSGAALVVGAFVTLPYYLAHASTEWIVGTMLATGFLAFGLFWLIRRPDRDAREPGGA